MKVKMQASKLITEDLKVVKGTFLELTKRNMSSKRLIILKKQSNQKG